MDLKLIWRIKLPPPPLFSASPHLLSSPSQPGPSPVIRRAKLFNRYLINTGTVPACHDARWTGITEDNVFVRDDSMLLLLARSVGLSCFLSSVIQPRLGTPLSLWQDPHRMDLSPNKMGEAASFSTPLSRFLYPYSKLRHSTSNCQLISTSSYFNKTPHQSCHEIFIRHLITVSWAWRLEKKLHRALY